MVDSIETIELPLSASRQLNNEPENLLQSIACSSVNLNENSSKLTNFSNSDSSDKIKQLETKLTKIKQKSHNNNYSIKGQWLMILVILALFSTAFYIADNGKWLNERISRTIHFQQSKSEARDNMARGRLNTEITNTANKFEKKLQLLKSNYDISYNDMKNVVDNVKSKFSEDVSKLIEKVELLNDRLDKFDDSVEELDKKVEKRTLSIVNLGKQISAINNDFSNKLESNMYKIKSVDDNVTSQINQLKKAVQNNHQNMVKNRESIPDVQKYNNELVKIDPTLTLLKKQERQLEWMMKVGKNAHHKLHMRFPDYEE